MKLALVIALFLQSTLSLAACRYLGVTERAILKRNACFSIAKFHGRPGMISGCLSQATFNLCDEMLLEVDRIPSEGYNPLRCTLKVFGLDAVTNVECSESN